MSAPAPKPPVPIPVPATYTCTMAQDAFRPYVEGKLDPHGAATLLMHLNGCKKCKEGFEVQRRMLSLLDQTFSAKRISDGFEKKANARLAAARSRSTSAQVLPVEAHAPTSEFAALEPQGEEAEAALGRRSENPWITRFRGAPWWLVSSALHALVLIFVALITATLSSDNGPELIVVTHLEKPPAIIEKEEPKPVDILESKVKVEANDPQADPIPVIVPPDLQAEVLDHFETNNPDRPDTQSAAGDPSAQVFHAPNESEQGGGGTEGESLSDTVGIAGAGTPGSGGGFGGGQGTGVGTGKGSGLGSFGQRGGAGRRTAVAKHGGSAATESAVNRGLEWLARNQEADGHWDAGKFGANVNGAHGQNAGDSGDEMDTADTGFALLAFLGAGHSEKVGKYRDNVRRAVAWLIAKQQANGQLVKGEAAGYGHAIAGMALAEAAGMAKIAETVKAAQKAIERTCGKGTKTENLSEKDGWSYSAYELADMKTADLSNSGWHIMFLKSAKMAGLHVDAASFDGAERFLNGCEIKSATDEYDRHKYRYYPYNLTNESPQRSFIGQLCRLFMGHPREELEKGVKWAVETGGVPDGVGQWTYKNLYYTYYGTLVTFQMGGEVWTRWNNALKKTLPSLQIQGGANDGSWDPKGEYSEDWGRVGQTALSILCLEVYYRYLQMQK